MKKKDLKKYNLPNDIINAILIDDWTTVSKYKYLSEDFIKEFKDKVNWPYISAHQKLSEDFIREFQDRIDWHNISIYQKLSEKFIREFQDNIYISAYQKLSEDFIKEFDLKIPETNWLYKSDEFKRNAILKTKLYDIGGDYIIAYKGIRSDNYSKYNFQYKYEVGNHYTSTCDCNIDEENSFGLSAWTLEDAKGYCNEKIIKVKIYLSELGCIVHDGHKLRCHGFEVIEEL